MNPVSFAKTDSANIERSVLNAFTVPVPAGSRAATMDGAKTFKTLINAEILPGSLYVDVKARATQSGASASGLLPGQISSLVDPLPYIAQVTNIDASIDGSDIEDDERLRERIRFY